MCDDRDLILLITYSFYHFFYSLIYWNKRKDRRQRDVCWREQKNVNLQTKGLISEFEGCRDRAAPLFWSRFHWSEPLSFCLKIRVDKHLNNFDSSLASVEGGRKWFFVYFPKMRTLETDLTQLINEEKIIFRQDKANQTCQQPGNSQLIKITTLLQAAIWNSLSLSG